MGASLSDFLMPVLLAAGTICAVAELFLMGLVGFAVCLAASLLVVVGVYCLQRFGAAAVIAASAVVGSVAAFLL